MRAHVTTPAPRERWRALLAQDPGSLPEHTPAWVDAICDAGRYVDASRLYSLPDGRELVLPLVRRRGAAGTGGWFSSYPHAWGMGGLVGPGADGEAVAAVVEDLRGLGAARVSIRPDPLTADDWARAAGRGVISIPRRAHVVDLTGGADRLYSLLGKNTRRGLRTAEKRGVHVEMDRTGRLLPVYYDLYLRSVDRWAGKQHEPRALAHWRARHRDPLAKLSAMARHLGDSFCLFLAYVDGRAAAGSILLLGRNAHDTRGAMDRELASRTRANDALQWAALSHACASGCAQYHLGESGGSTSLAAYKERFGGVAFPYAEYRIETLPLTRVDTAVRSTAKKVLGFRDV